MQFGQLKRREFITLLVAAMPKQVCGPWRMAVPLKSSTVLEWVSGRILEQAVRDDWLASQACGARTSATRDCHAGTGRCIASAQAQIRPYNVSRPRSDFSAAC
jgi:hypothetical protein